MEGKSEITLIYFLGGFACIVLSSILKAFLLQQFVNALIISVGLAIMSYYLVQLALRIKEKLYVETNSAIKGLIEQQ